MDRHSRLRSKSPLSIRMAISRARRPSFLELRIRTGRDAGTSSTRYTSISPAGRLPSTNHFTDWAFLKTLYILPQKATLRVGESVKMDWGGCDLRGGFGVWFYKKFSIWWVRDRVKQND